MTSKKSALRLFPLKKWQHLLIKNNGILFLNYRKIFVNVSYYKLLIFALSQRTFWSFMWLILFTSQALCWFLFQLFLTSNHAEHSMWVYAERKFFLENKRHSLLYSLFFPRLTLLLAFSRLHFCGKSLCENHEDCKYR